MNLHILLVNTVLPVFLMSTLVTALFAYWFALAAARSLSKVESTA